MSVQTNYGDINNFDTKLLSIEFSIDSNYNIETQYGDTKSFDTKLQSVEFSIDGSSSLTTQYGDTKSLDTKIQSIETSIDSNSNIETKYGETLSSKTKIQSIELSIDSGAEKEEFSIIERKYGEALSSKTKLQSIVTRIDNPSSIEIKHGNIEPAQEIIKYLIKDNNVIKTFDGTWQTLEEPLDESDFENSGMNNLSEVKFQDLSSESPEILIWTQDVDNDKKIEADIIPYAQLVMPNSDINLLGVKSIEDITLDYNLGGEQMFEGDLGQISGDDTVETTSFDFSDTNGVKISCSLESEQMNNNDENLQLLWYTGTEWKLIEEAHNETKDVEFNIPSDWLSENNKIQLDIVAGGSGESAIHTTGNGPGDLATVHDLKIEKISSADIKLICSKDEGETWQNPIKDIDVDLNIDSVQNDGIYPKDFNNITSETWNNYIGESEKIRFAYCLSIEKETDIAETDLLQMTVDLDGSWTAATKGTDYNYSYNNSDKIIVDLLKDGSYKINYQK